jgi:hypothetical protein
LNHRRADIFLSGKGKEGLFLIFPQFKTIANRSAAVAGLPCF